MRTGDQKQLYPSGRVRDTSKTERVPQRIDQHCQWVHCRLQSLPGRYYMDQPVFDAGEKSRSCHDDSHQGQSSNSSRDVYIALHDQERLVGNRLCTVIHQTAKVRIQIRQGLHFPWLRGARLPVLD